MTLSLKGDVRCHFLVVFQQEEAKTFLGGFEVQTQEMKPKHKVFFCDISI